MTASKSSRARNARNGAQAGTARNGNAARNSGTARNGGTAVKAGTAAKPAVRPETAARPGCQERQRDTEGAARPGTARFAGVHEGSRPRTASAPARRPGPALWLQIATFVLALAGLGVSIYLTIAHFTESTLAGCSESGLVNCTKVTTSPQSYVFGIPVAVLGLAFYVFAVAIMSPWAWRATRREIHLLRIASLVVGIGFVLYLIYAELFLIGSICLYCTSVHALTFLLFVLTMFAVAVWGLKPGAAWPERLRLKARAAS